jgi:hypothetical protein
MMINVTLITAHQILDVSPNLSPVMTIILVPLTPAIPKLAVFSNLFKIIMITCVSLGVVNLLMV